MFYVTGSAATLNYAPGFDTGFSFYYASLGASSVTVYDGLNATGSVLATLTVPATPNPYYVWSPIGVSFSGTAKSIDFGGAANFNGFDNITFGSATPTDNSVVPLPASVWTGMALLAALGAGRLLATRLAKA